MKSARAALKVNTFAVGAFGHMKAPYRSKTVDLSGCPYMMKLAVRFTYCSNLEAVFGRVATATASVLKVPRVLFEWTADVTEFIRLPSRVFVMSSLTTIAELKSFNSSLTPFSLKLLGSFW